MKLLQIVSHFAAWWRHFEWANARTLTHQHIQTHTHDLKLHSHTVLANQLHCQINQNLRLFCTLFTFASADQQQAVHLNTLDRERCRICDNYILLIYFFLLQFHSSFEFLFTIIQYLPCVSLTREKYQCLHFARCEFAECDTITKSNLVLYYSQYGRWKVTRIL